MFLKLLGFIVFYLTISPLSCYTSSTIEAMAYMFFVCSLCFYNRKYRLFNEGIYNDIRRTVLLFCIAFVIPAFIHFQTPFVTDVLQWMSILIIISLKNEYRSVILRSAVNLFTIVLVVAIVEYIVGFITGFSRIIYTNNSGEILFTQSFANLYRYGNLQYRFSALTSEPGELGATCGFILAFLPFNRKYIYHLIACIVGGILSLSLAFYLYMAFILLYKTVTGFVKIKYTLIISVILLSASMLFYEEIQAAIFLRLAETEQVDNRSSEQVNKFVLNIFDTTDAIYGVGNRTAYVMQEDSGEGNAGFKWKLFQYGIVGCGSYFIAMLLLYKRHRNRNVSYLFGIIFFLMYFYSVGMWGVPLYMLLLFTTLSNDSNGQRNLGYENYNLHA